MIIMHGCMHPQRNDMKFKILLIHKLNKSITVLLHNSVEKFNLTKLANKHTKNQKKIQRPKKTNKQTITREKRPDTP